MGIVRKQSVQSSVLQYVGAGIGFLNRIFLLTQFLPTAGVGITSFLLTNALMFSQFGALGLPTLILKYFPYFRRKESGHHGFFRWVMGVSIVGFLFVSLNFVIFKPTIAGYFAEKSSQFLDYYYYLIPLGFFAIYMEVFDAYLRSNFKTVVPFFIREVGQRLAVMLSVIVYALGWVDFEGFVILFVALVCSLSLVVVGYMIFLGQFHFRTRPGFRMKMLRGRMVRYAGFSYLSGISNMLIYTIDQWMLGGMEGMAAVGIYTTSFFVTSLILIPWKALAKITTPMVAEHWKDRNMPEIARLYRRTSLLNLLTGSFLFLGLYINADNLFRLLPPEYAAGLFTLVYIGLTRLFVMVTGLNAYILLNSDKYKWDVALSTLMIGVTIVTNYYLIPIYGIDGAALATLLTFVSVNIVRTFLVYGFFRLQPFSWRMLLVLGTAAAGFFAQFWLPYLGMVWLDIIVRSVVFTLVFGGLTLLLKPAPDVNDFAALILKRLGLAKGK